MGVFFREGGGSNFPGDNFSRDSFPGGHNSGRGRGNFPGRIFLGGFFPGGLFSRGHFSGFGEEASVKLTKIQDNLESRTPIYFSKQCKNQYVLVFLSIHTTSDLVSLFKASFYWSFVYYLFQKEIKVITVVIFISSWIGHTQYHM